MQNRRFDEGDCLEKIFRCEVATTDIAQCLNDEQCLILLIEKKCVGVCVSLHVVVRRIRRVYFHISESHKQSFVSLRALRFIFLSSYLL